MSDHAPISVSWSGIFESRTLWAGHLGYMNDTSEVGHAIDVSREVVGRLKGELPRHRVALDRWITYITDSPPKSWAPNLFATSFSEVPNLLSQWRGYATGAGGPICIGFPSAVLKERVGAQDGVSWALRRCIYSREEQARLIEARIRSALDIAANRAEGTSERSQQELGYSFVFAAVMGIAPLCKHPDFAEEQEWRLVVGPVDIKEMQTVHFVERRHTLAPYIEFRLCEGSRALDDIHWIAGPNPQQERSNLAMGMVARTAGMTRYQGVNSQTPYMP